LQFSLQAASPETFGYTIVQCGDIEGYGRFGGLRRLQGGNMFLRNVCILPQHYAASQLKRPLLEYLPGNDLQESGSGRFESIVLVFFWIDL
jgi:hypothetical protein